MEKPTKEELSQLKIFLEQLEICDDKRVFDDGIKEFIEKHAILPRGVAMAASLECRKIIGALKEGYQGFINGTEDIYETLDYTPLYLAARRKDVKAVQVLIEAEVDVNVACTKGGRVPLHVAAAIGHLDVVVALISAGAIVNKKCDDDTTALRYSIRQKCDLGVVQELLRAGADTKDRCSSTGQIPLFLAVSKERHDDVIRALAEKTPNVDEADCFKQTALHAMAEKGDYRGMATLIEFKADVDINSYLGGSTALHAAAGNGHTEAVNVLMERCANVHARDGSGKGIGKTPLQLASERGHLDTVKALIRNGAKNGEGESLIEDKTRQVVTEDGRASGETQEEANLGASNSLLFSERVTTNKEEGRRDSEDEVFYTSRFPGDDS